MSRPNARKLTENSGRWSRLLFDGDEKNYELWEIKFLGHLRLPERYYYYGARRCGDSGRSGFKC